MSNLTPADYSLCTIAVLRDASIYFSLNMDVLAEWQQAVSHQVWEAAALQNQGVSGAVWERLCPGT
jgi:hypothetical protein